MNKIITILSIGLTLLFSCIQKKDKTITITPQIEYDVTISNTNKNADWWIQNIEGPKRESFVKQIMESALAGRCRLFDFELDESTKNLRHTKPITAEQLKAQLTSSGHSLNNILSNVDKLRFREEWKIDTATLSITKKVKGFAPVISIYNDSGSFIGNKLLIWIEPDSTKQTTDSKKTIITERIQYDVFIKSPDTLKDWWVDNIERTDREKLAKLIIDKVSKGQIKAYDFPLNTELTAKDISFYLNPAYPAKLKRTTAPYDTYDTTITQPLSPDKIIKLRFLEEWSFDPQSLSIEKKILGIVPIRENFAPDGTFRGYTPMFWIYLDKRYPAKDMNL